ncbi:MAG: FkbM family methyltransferase [Candidatus Babeliales bacterium]|nr:FkbM family methyltransferase [Candidatus Babeliales bacterium]
MKRFLQSLIILLNIFWIHSDVTTLKYNLVNGLPDIYITPNTEQIGHTWSNGNVWDKELIQKFYSLLPVDNSFVVIDIGAQTGSFTLLSKYFPKSIWYAFEPIYEAANALKENLVLNGITNVSVYQKAVSDFSGTTTLYMPNMNEWGLSTIGSNVLRFNTSIKREIECIDLDTFVEAENIQKVNFMKLDTEGAEMSILRGAKKTIIRDHPIILMEYNETNMKQCNVLKEEIDQFFKDVGYEWKLISSEDILCIPIVTETTC